MLSAVSLAAVHDARERIRGIATRTPLVQLHLAGLPFAVYLKLENLQPIGSFKIRGAANAMRSVDAKSLSSGVYTASAGNMAQGVAWCAREMHVPCTVIVPERAPQTKIDAVQRLGATVLKVPFDAWWRTMQDHAYPGMHGLFIHPFADERVMAGNGTIALEIFEDLPEADTLLVPFGGGGLACGIAAAARAVGDTTSVYACEVETSAPLRASYAQGAAATVNSTPSFVDGIGGKSVFPEVWPLAYQLLRGSRVVSLAQVASAVKLLVERARVVAEGAGAAPVAVALDAAEQHSLPDAKHVVCVVSGGNINSDALAKILNGEVP